MTPDYLQHSLNLVYPFRHVLPDGDGPGARRRQLRRRGGAWHPWWSRFSDQAGEAGISERIEIADAAFFFDPHVRKILYPGLPEFLPDDQRAFASEINRLAEAQPWSPAAGGDHGLLRLTLAPDSLAPLACPHHIEGEFGPNVPLCFQFNSIDLLLHPQNVGFLVFNVSLAGQACTHGQLLALIQELYNVLPLHSYHRPSRLRPQKPGGFAFEMRHLIDFLLNGWWQEQAPSPAASGADLLAGFEAFLRSPAPRYSQTQEGQGYGQYLRCFVFAAQGPRPPASDPLFAFEHRRRLYELASCTNTAEAAFHPHPQRVEEIMRRNLVTLWASWEALALNANVVFLQLDDRFAFLRSNVERDYFPLYLLTLFQHARLNWLSAEIVAHRPADDRIKTIEGKLEQFIRFRNEFWFEAVTNRSQGVILFKKFQDCLGVARLYDLVSDEIRELHAHLKTRTDQQLQRRIKIAERFVTYAFLLGTAISIGLDSPAKQQLNAWIGGLAAVSKLGNDLSPLLRILLLWGAIVAIANIGRIAFWLADLARWVSRRLGSPIRR